MITSIRIRRMLATDADAAVALAAQLPSAPHWPRGVYMAVADSTLKPVRIALVAEAESGQMSGFVLASLIAPQAELESIVVSAEFQRQGIARQLFEQICGELATRGATEIFLEVRASNQSAQGLYGALGFTQNGRRKHYYSHPTEDALVFHRAL